jgi:hypothetical protein
MDRRDIAIRQIHREGDIENESYGPTEQPSIPLEKDEELIQVGWGSSSSFWLTSTRLIQDRRTGWLGREEQTFVLPLDQITSMSVGYIRRTRLLVFGATFVLLGIVARYAINPNIADVLWLIGVASTIAYVVTGGRGIIVNGHSVQIKFATRGGTADRVRSFVSALELARLSALGIDPDSDDLEEPEDEVGTD